MKERLSWVLILEVFKCSKEFFNVTLFLLTENTNYGWVLFFFSFLAKSFLCPFIVWSEILSLMWDILEINKIRYLRNSHLNPPESFTQTSFTLISYFKLLLNSYLKEKLRKQSHIQLHWDGRSQDGGGIGRRDHFLFYKFIERATEWWRKFTKQLLIASRGHQAPRKAAHCLRREVGQKY